MIRKTLFHLLYIVAVVALILAIALSFHPLHKHKKTPVAKTPAGSSLQKSSPKLATPKSSSSSASSSSSSSSSKTTTPPATTPATAPASTPALVNTGPGDVIGLFVVGFSVGTVGFERYRRKTL